jgi:mono/diheme cytochrome c family protein
LGKFWAGFVAGLIVTPLIAACYVVLGMAPAATSAPPMPLERFIAGAALNSRISRESSPHEPANSTDADLADGAVVYAQHCAACHGSDRQPAPPIGKAMYPEAPQLLTPEGMTSHPVEVIYWEVQNGIRLTGMPSFESILREKEKWDVSAMLSRVSSLPPEAQQALTATPDSTAQCPAAREKLKRRMPEVR